MKYLLFFGSIISFEVLKYRWFLEMNLHGRSREMVYLKSVDVSIFLIIMGFGMGGLRVKRIGLSGFII